MVENASFDSAFVGWWRMGIEEIYDGIGPQHQRSCQLFRSFDGLSYDCDTEAYADNSRDVQITVRLNKQQEVYIGVLSLFPHLQTK